MLHILTLSWNAADKLSKLRNSLTPSLAGIDYVWHIKDNGSKDNTVATASTWGDNVKVYAYKNNAQNFAAGCNYLFKLADPKDDDFVMLLNNDVVFNDTHSISAMMNIMNKDPDVGAVGARLLYSDTDKLQHAGVVFDKRYQLPTHFRTKEKSDDNSSKNREFQAVTGAVLLTKASIFKNVCTTNISEMLGMDENYHWAFDDVDLCLSIKYGMNKKIIYCGKTNVFHEESASLKKNPANKMFLSHNITYLRKKWEHQFVIDSDIYAKNPKHNLYQEM
jgi:GT2 family glycosyltransferase